MDIKQRLTELKEAGLRAANPRNAAMVDPLFAHTVAKEALEVIEARETLLERCLSPIEDEFSVTELELTTEIRRVLGKPPWGTS